MAPIVFRTPKQRGAALAEALALADALGELGLPVFLYGLLAGGRTRAELRKGGAAGLAQRMADGLRPDFGPDRMHPTAGAVLVAARPPLVAFNLELGPQATGADAQAVARAIREGGPGGLPGLRAIGLTLAARGGVAQVSCNVEDHEALRAGRAARGGRAPRARRRGRAGRPGAAGGLRRLARSRPDPQPGEHRGATKLLGVPKADARRSR